MGLTDRLVGIAGRRFLKFEGFVNASITTEDMVRLEFRETLEIEIRRATGVMEKVKVPKPGDPEVIEVPLKELMKLSNLGGKADEQREQPGQLSAVSSVQSAKSST